MTRQHGTGSNPVLSPAGSRKSGYQMAPSRPPLADNEDFSPGQETFSLLDASERVSLQSYNQEGQGRSNIQETSYILDKRPPVEGRDSLSKDSKVDYEANLEQQSTCGNFRSASYIPPARLNVATVRELQCSWPKVKPLPLLQNGDKVDLSSPGSRDASPFRKTQLFTDEMIESPLSDVVADDTNVDLEYDDYMPQLPGSYFTMDPQAYTLTWSKQPTWAHQHAISRTASDTSAGEQH